MFELEQSSWRNHNQWIDQDYGSIWEMAKTFEPDTCRRAGHAPQGTDFGGTSMGHMAYCYVSSVCDAYTLLADG